MNGNLDDKIAFAKFRKKESYIIRINTCSQYELFPEKNPKMGSVEFYCTENKEDLNLKFCIESVLFNKFNSRKPILCIPSAMCRFSKKKISIFNKDEKIDSFYYHFLHQENLFLKFLNKKIIFKIQE